MNPRHTARWRKVRKQVLQGATICQIPGCLHPSEPLRHEAHKNHPLKAVVDHIVPVAETYSMSAGDQERYWYDPRYLRPAHRVCNSARNQNKLRPGNPNPTSRDWGV